MKFFLIGLFFLLMISVTMGYQMSYIPGLSIKNLLIYLFFLATLFKLKNNCLSFNIISLNIFFLVLIFVAFLSWVTSINFSTKIDYDYQSSFLALKSLIDRYLFFFIFFFFLREKNDIVWAIKAILFIVIIGNIITIIDVFNIPDLGVIHERRDGRVSGPLGESNQYGAFLVFFLPTLISIAFYSKGYKKYFYVLGGGASVLVWIMTVSRGSMVGIIFGFLIGLPVLKNYINLKIFLAKFILVIPIALVTVSFALYRYYELLYSRIIVGTGHAENITEISSGRILIWSNALDKLFDSPLNIIFGMGWHTFLQFFVSAPHNVYLNFLFELGILGLFLIFIIYYKVFKISFDSLRYSDSFEKTLLVSFLFGYFSLLGSIFFVDLYNPWIFIWSYIGLVTRLALEISNEQSPR